MDFTRLRMLVQKIGTDFSFGGFGAHRKWLRLRSRSNGKIRIVVWFLVLLPFRSLCMYTSCGISHFPWRHNVYSGLMRVCNGSFMQPKTINLRPFEYARIWIAWVFWWKSCVFFSQSQSEWHRIVSQYNTRINAFLGHHFRRTLAITFGIHTHYSWCRYPFILCVVSLQLQFSIFTMHKRLK